MSEIKKHIGRPSIPIIYYHIEYNDKKYVIGIVKHNDTNHKFVIDEDDFVKIKDLSWHYTSYGYISHSVIVDNKKKNLYLHNVIMDNIVFPGKGARQTIDHINRIGLDNRKDNLRWTSQTEQNLNQKKKERHISLPDELKIDVQDIPKHIWYIKPNGAHGDRFAIEFKTEKIIWKTTSSKKISLEDKLQMAKEKLKEFYKQYPYLDPNNVDINNKMTELIKSYENIISNV